MMRQILIEYVFLSVYIGILSGKKLMPQTTQTHEAWFLSLCTGNMIYHFVPLKSHALPPPGEAFGGVTGTSSTAVKSIIRRIY